MNKVTVISVYYNRDDCVDSSLDSVINQLNDIDELIIVDDGSSDNTLSKISNYAHHKKVKVLSEKNKGFTKCIIKAVGVATGDYIAIHGSGDISNPDRFKLQKNILDTHQNIVLVGSKTNSIYSDNSRPGETVGKYFNGCAKVLMSKSNLFSHGEVMFRKSSYNQVGGYREEFEFAQDKDLWCRMSTVGKFYKIDEVLYSKFKNRHESVSGSIPKLYKQQLLSCYAEYLHINSGYSYLENISNKYKFLEFNLSLKQKIKFLKIFARLYVSNNGKDIKLFKPRGLHMIFIAKLFVLLLRITRKS